MGRLCKLYIPVLNQPKIWQLHNCQSMEGHHCWMNLANMSISLLLYYNIISLTYSFDVCMYVGESKFFSDFSHEYGMHHRMKSSWKYWEIFTHQQLKTLQLYFNISNCVSQAIEIFLLRLARYHSSTREYL